ncbi:MAG: serine/threonine-protein kinase [Byssovorax sp.]
MPALTSTTTSKTNLAEVAAKAKAEARLGSVVSGRYKLTEVLAMGGVGVVFKGEHIHMRKWVAIKVLHPDAQDAPDLVARFQREAVAGAHIQHPNVAAATDFGELDDGAFFLVLEYVRGATLREIIKRGPLPVERAVDIARQIAAALGATHAIGIVHRDVTPRNVMVIEGATDAVKLIDFGLAKVDTAQLESFALITSERGIEHEQRITGTGAVFGTIAYLAPEVARGMDLVDARADLYALGLVLYEMLSGKHCFDTTDAVELFKRHAAARPPPIAVRAPGVVVPPALEAVVMRLLEKSPDARFSSGEAVIAALDAALDARPITLTPTPTPVTITALETALPAPIVPAREPMPSMTAASGRKRLPFVAVGVAVLVVSGLALRLSRSSSPDAPPREAAATLAPAPSNVVATATPVAAPSVAAAIAAPVAPVAGSIDPVARALFRNALAAHDFKHGIEHFFTLVEHDQAAFHEPLLATAVRDLAVTVAAAPGDDTDRIFDALAHRLGSDGVDILYEIMRTRGGSKAATRAEALLAQSEVIARGTPSLQITYALRSAPCADKLALLDRAVAGGDVRTQVVMETTCKSCFARNQALEDATKALRQRLSQRPTP